MAGIVERVKVRVGASELWFGFPHWVVLGWAVLLSYNVWELMDWRKEHTAAGDRSLTMLNQSITALQASTSALQEDSIRMRAILELKFPKTSRQVDEIFREGESPQ